MFDVRAWSSYSIRQAGPFYSLTNIRQSCLYKMARAQCALISQVMTRGWRGNTMHNWQAHQSGAPPPNLSLKLQLRLDAMRASYVTVASVGETPNLSPNFDFYIYFLSRHCPKK